MTQIMPMPVSLDKLEEAEGLYDGGELNQSCNVAQSILTFEINPSNEKMIEVREKSILLMGKILSKQKKADELEKLIKFSRSFLNYISKAKAAKMVKQLIEDYLSMDQSGGKEIELLKECIDWAKQERRVYLRLSLQSQLTCLLYERKYFKETIELANTLLYELKKLDEKYLLVDVMLCESKTYFALNNVTKAKASLVAARTTANSIYTPPLIQAALDLQSGIIHAAEDIDFKTAHSYFFESFEGYDKLNDANALRALKYMYLAKIMLGHPQDVLSQSDSKIVLKYQGRDIEALKAVATASAEKSLDKFQKALDEYKAELQLDNIINKHLDALYNKMLEDNLSRLIEPYSRVEISHISKTIGLNQSVVEAKLSQMILDSTLPGILDQESGSIILYETTPSDSAYDTALETCAHFDLVVEALFDRAKRL